MIQIHDSDSYKKSLMFYIEWKKLNMFKSKYTLISKNLMTNMLFQLSETIIFGIIIIVASYIITFLIGMYMMRWYARKKWWDNSLKTAFLVNLIWLLSGTPISILFSMLFGTNLLVELLELVIAIAIGTIVVKYLYKVYFIESFVFVIIIELILFLISIVLGVVLGIVLSIVFLSLQRLGIWP